MMGQETFSAIPPALSEPIRDSSSSAHRHAPALRRLQPPQSRR